MLVPLVVLFFVVVLVVVGVGGYYYWRVSRRLDERLTELEEALTDVREEVALEYRLFDDLTDVAADYMKHQREELDRLGNLSPDVGSTVKDVKASKERLLELKIDFFESVQDYPELVDDAEFQEILEQLEKAQSRRERKVDEYNRLAEEYNEIVVSFMAQYVAAREGYSWARPI